MDDTLLTPDKTVHPDTVRDIRSASENAIQIVYCSGRGQIEIRPYYQVLNTIRYAICSNGSFIYDCLEERCIFRDEIEGQYVVKITEMALEAGAMPFFELEDGIMLAKKDLDHIEDYHMEMYKPLYDRYATCVDDMLEAARRISAAPKLNIYFRTPEDRAEGLRRVSHLPLHYNFAETTSLEVVAPGVTKGTGFRQLAKYLGIPMSETAAIGDSYNDQEMLLAAALPIAMGNARPEILSLCRFHTDDNLHNGVGKALRRIISGEYAAL